MHILSVKDNEDNVSKKRWEYLYKATPANYQKLETIGKSEYLYLKKYVKGKRGKFLEIGCGMGACALEVSKNKGWKTYGIDYCIDNLKGAKKYWQYFNAKPNLIYGDIKKMPYKNNSFDLLYGSGVLEHIYDTKKAVKETYRVLKLGGISVNTVPAFSLASLTYRQLSGTIPNVPILKPIYEFIHIKLLRRKFMHAGYEKCFTKKNLIEIYKKVGFSKVNVSHDKKFEPYLKNFPEFLRKIIIKLEKTKPFWAWYVITAQK